MDQGMKTQRKAQRGGGRARRNGKWKTNGQGRRIFYINLIGDVMLGRLIDQLFPVHVHNPEEAHIISTFKRKHPDLQTYSARHPWGSTLPLFQSSDLNLINLETSVTTTPNPWPNKAFNYRMHPANLGRILNEARIDYVNLANNHTLDFGPEGLIETVKALVGERIAFSGVGETYETARASCLLTLPRTSKGGGGTFHHHGRQLKSPTLPITTTATVSPLLIEGVTGARVGGGHGEGETSEEASKRTTPKVPTQVEPEPEPEPEPELDPELDPKLDSDPNLSNKEPVCENDGTNINNIRYTIQLYSASDHPTDWAAIPTFHLIDYSPSTKARLRSLLTSNQPRSRRSPSLRIFSVHWGPNYAWRPSAEIRSMAHFLVDECGVDIVHGHSAHHVQGVERYRGRLIIYGCGDFVDDYAIDGTFRNDLGAVWRVSIVEEWDGQGLQGKIEPEIDKAQRKQKESEPDSEHGDADDKAQAKGGDKEEEEAAGEEEGFQWHLRLDKLEIFPTCIHHFQAHLLDRNDPDHRWLCDKITALSEDLGIQVSSELGLEGQLIIDLQ
jgi:hypothetical protein